MNMYKGIIIIGVLSLLVGCVTQPVKKSSDYNVTYLSSEEIDKRDGKFVLVVNEDGKYKVQRVSDAFSGDFKQDYFGDVVSDGVLWVKGTTVSPYLFTPSSGHGQYDNEDKTFLCYKSLRSSPPRDYKHPHPCWSPFVKYDNPLEYLSSHERKIKEIDYDEIVKSIEESQLFKHLNDPNIGKIDKIDANAMSYLKVRYNNTAAITKVDDYIVQSDDNILELNPGDHRISMYCMLNPRGHGAEKGKKVVEGIYEFKAGYYNYITDGRGIAMVGIVCSPQLKMQLCRHVSDQCEKQ